MSYLMTAETLITKLKNATDNFKTVYALGMFGQPITESIIQQKTRQLPGFYTAAKQAELRNLIGKGYFGFDCVCFEKGAGFWGWTGNANDTNGGAKYCSNGVPDVSDSGMIAMCVDVSTDFKNIVPGECLWMSGHTGVYIGNGVVVECTPKWKNGCQYSNLANIGYTSGNSRTWTKHGKFPWVDYTVKAETPAATTPSTEKKYYRVQIGSFEVKDNAIKMANQAKTKGFSVIIKKFNTHYRVQIGAYENPKNAEAEKQRAIKAGYSGAYVTTEGGTDISF